MSTPHRLARLGSAALVAACLGFTATPALACGGFFCMNQPIDQAGERILFIQDGDNVTAHVQVKFQGDAKQFSWVVPTPTEPKLGVGSDALFRALDPGTAPRFQLSLKDEGDCYWPPRRAYEADDVQRKGGANLGAATERSVQVISQQQVGPYDSVVLRSDDPDALRRWLRTNGYILPPKLDPLLDPYVAGKFYFVALKLQQDRGTGDLQPITLTYKASKPGIPIRLTGVAATKDMDVFVWVLGDQRAVPENYRHAVINEARVDWVGDGRYGNGSTVAGGNYKDVVTHAVDEAGGQAFVTDYAGSAKVVDLTGFRGDRWDLSKLATLTDPILFLRAVQDDGYFDRGSPSALAFVKRYVPIPHSLGGVWEPGFYSNPEQYRTQLRREGVSVDAAKAADELRKTVVEPAQAIQTAFLEHHYMTRLYTTMSPEEMTQDPTFRFNASLPRVDNLHTASGVRDCTHHRDGETAPIRITLADGRSFMAQTDPDKGPWGFPEDDQQDGGLSSLAPSSVTSPFGLASAPPPMPAALRVEQLTTEGAASVIQDNRAAIDAALGLAVKAAQPAASGMACSQHAVPETNPAPGKQPDAQGAGEPATYALVLAIWWRVLRRRPRR